MATDSNGIPRIILDPRNEEALVVQMAQRTRSASNNTLRDFSAASPLSALAEGQAFAIAELLYYLNLLPSAVALEALRQTGVTRRVGTYSQGSLTFLLTSTLSQPYFLPQGYQLPYEGFYWVLTEDLYIPAGAIEGRVAVRSSMAGSAYNRAAYGVAFQPGLNYVQSVYNPEPILGGSDLEALTDTITRGQQELRSRSSLVSKADFEAKTQELLGSDFRATCIPLMTSDKEVDALGHAHIFGVSYDWQLPSKATCQTIQAQLNELSFVASRIWMSPADLEPVTIETILEVDQLSDTLAQSCLQMVKDYLSPKSFGLGSPIRVKELEYRLRSVPGVLAILDTLVDNSALDRAMPLPYSHPKIELFTVTMSDPDGYSQTYYLGDGLGDQD